MNEKYDNWFSDMVLAVVGTIVRTLERSMVTFWDGLRSAVEHQTPSVLGFVAAVLPILTPLPVSIMTARNLTTFLLWDMWQAVLMAAGIEAVGFVVWVTLTETLIEGGWKGTTMQFFFSAAVLAYQAVVIIINGVLTFDSGASGPYVAIFTLLSFFPALGAVCYAYRNAGNKQVLERERQEAAALKERVRQEARADRKEARELKLRYASDVKAEKLPFRGKR